MKPLLICLILLIFFFPTTNGQQWQWAKGAGTGFAGIATDNYGHIYSGGAFRNASITFGEITLPNAGTDSTEDIFIVKYDTSGYVLWAHRAGGIYIEETSALTTDVAGAVYIGGITYSDTIIFDTITLSFTGTSSNNMFLAKYDSSGHVVWAKNFGGGDIGGDIDPESISVDALGNVYVSGVFSSTWVTFGTTTLSNSTGAPMFLVKFSPSGNVVWAKAVQGGAGYYVSSDIDTMGHIYVTGTFGGTVSFDAISLFSNGSNDMFLAKYDTSGNVIWAKNYGTPDAEYGNNLTTEISGNVFISGFFHGPSFPLGPDILVNSYSPITDYYLVKLDSSGNVVWARNSIGPGNVGLAGVAVDHSDNVYTTARFVGSTITFGHDTLHNSNPGNFAIFVTKYDALGNNIWSTGPTGIAGTSSGGIAINSYGQVYITGAILGPALYIADTTFTGSYRGEYFIARLDTALHHTNSLPAIIGRKNGINIFPNPNTGKLTVQLNTTGVTGLQIYDCLARQLYTTILTGTENTTQIELQNISSGLYYLHATGSAHNENIPFVVSR